ncbi:MAG TPA: acyl-CoA synthetase, partial [Alphaproteobacteria bacterium]|nr:acyl-CoA synthetase [Alphaproteobacteria bacterium]
DAAFLGINRHAVIEVTAELAAMGCGGAVCFASGFAETGDDDLQQQLVEAAGDMPLLGPNCYGVLNYLDGAMLWPDQHGGRAVDRGVAIISQSSNIAINISMQARGVPIAYTACVGNQAQTSLADMARSLLADPRVTAAGLYIEGIVDAGDFAAMVAEAAAAGKSIVAIKSGKTEAARHAASSHTAALAGDGAASSAFLARCGVIEATSPEEMMEVLKILHLFGRLPGNRLTAMCCSGGEAGLTADLAGSRQLVWPQIPDANRRQLAETLGPLVALANPLDYHTFIWG